MNYLISADRKKGRKFSVGDKTEYIRSSDKLPGYMDMFVEMTKNITPGMDYRSVVIYEGVEKEFSAENYAEFKQLLEEIKNRIDSGWNLETGDWFDFSISVFEN